MGDELDVIEQQARLLLARLWELIEVAEREWGERD